MTSARFGHTELLIRVNGPALDVSRGEGAADLAFAAGPGIHQLISGRLTPVQAIETGVVEVLQGRSDPLIRFANTFDLAA